MWQIEREVSSQLSRGRSATIIADEHPECFVLDRPGAHESARRAWPLLARCCPKERAQPSPLCPGSSDIHQLSNGRNVVTLDAEITQSALNLGVIPQQLDGPKIACTTVDEGRSGPAKRMRAEETEIQSDT
jgi:hypothetical protein